MTDKSHRRLRRRLSAAVLLLMGLAVAGGLAATLTPTPQVAVADESASALLRRNLLIYGLGGIIVPFIGIKLVDLFITLIPGIG